MTCGQHRVGRGSRQNDGQFLAQIGEKLEDVQSGERHHATEHAEDEDRDRDVEQGDQRDELLERADAIFPDRIGDCAEHAERRDAHDQPHRPEQHGRNRVDKRRNLLALFAADQGEAGTEDDREKQHLQHVVARQRVE
jgi:hypothetical protein